MTTSTPTAPEATIAETAEETPTEHLQTETLPDAEAISTLEKARAYGALKAQHKTLGILLARAEEQLKPELIKQFQTAGTKVTNMILPDGTKFGAITLREESDKPVVSDVEALTQWLEEDDVLEMHVQTITRPDPVFVKNLFENLVTWVPQPDWEPNPDLPEDVEQKAPFVAVYMLTGAIVPGVTLQPAPKVPSSMGTTFEKPKKTGVKTESNQLTGEQRVLAFLQGGDGQDPVVSLLESSGYVELDKN